MHLIQRYALDSSSLISSPSILEKYFALPFSEYIVFQPNTVPAKTFSYWPSVLELLVPILNERGIQIVQVGGPNENPLPGTYCIAGQTSFNSLAYVIRNSKLVLSADSISVHLASGLDKPIVGVYGNANFLSSVRPYWGNKENHILLQDPPKTKPSFSREEVPKTIDRIKPEDIAFSVCSLLGIPFNYPYKTVFMGSNFHNLSIETIPNQIISITNLPAGHLVVRMDYEFHEPNLVEQLKLNKCTIVTDKPINKEILRTFKTQIQEVIYIIGDNHRPDFPPEIRRAGIPFRLVSYFNDEELNPIKLHYFDIGLITPVISRVPDELKDLDSFYYKSCKFTLSNQQAFNSKYAWKNGFAAKSLGDNFQQFNKNNPHAADFWLETENFHVLVDK
jgi:hypothetical protein